MARPARRRYSSTCAIIWSVWAAKSTIRGWMPQQRLRVFSVDVSGVKAKTGFCGRRRLRRRAESPDWVNVQMYFASSWSAIATAARVIAPPRVFGWEQSGGTRSRP